MYTRIVGLAFITILAIALFGVIRSVAKRYQDESDEKPTEFDQKIKERARKEQEEKNALREDPMNLSTERVLLRPVSILDKKPLSVILSDKAIAEPMGMERITRVKQMEKILRAEYLDTIGIYTIVSLSSMRVIGLAKLLYTEDDDQTMSVLLFISRQYWRHGMGREAAQALIAHATNDRGIKELITSPTVLNEQNRGFLESLGFKEEGDHFVLRIDNDSESLSSKADMDK